MNVSVSGSVINQVDQVIQQAVELGASDIHLEPFEKRYVLRYRMDGMLQEMTELQLNQKDAIISRIKIMASLDIAEKRRPQDGRIRIHSKQGNHQLIDLRVSSLPTDFGEKIVMRILDKSRQKLNLTSLGFEEHTLQEFKKAIYNPYGMILVTGPTGSGKTTTLYAALNELNTPEINITTIEDPIEYNLDGINQTKVHEDIGLSFSAILRSILRQDPNVIMVGEIRDGETAEIAIRSALTGHLVFSTLHTNDAPSAISRLVDMKVEPFLVASSVRLVMAQRLVRKVCERCAITYQPDEFMLRDLELEVHDTYLKGEGCEACNGSGYRGRTALIEIMPVSEQITSLIVQQANAYELKQTAQKEGMKTLRQTGIEKIKAGITTVEEVFKETMG